MHLSSKEIIKQAKSIERGMVSVLVFLPACELADLGTEPYQEFLILILKPQITFFASMFMLKNRVKKLGLHLGLFCWFGLVVG